jgi:hypothetical protein
MLDEMVSPCKPLVALPRAILPGTIEIGNIMPGLVVPGDVGFAAEESARQAMCIPTIIMETG